MVNKRKGMTLLEMVIVVGLVVVAAGMLFVFINPMISQVKTANRNKILAEVSSSVLDQIGSEVKYASTVQFTAPSSQTGYTKITVDGSGNIIRVSDGNTEKVFSADFFSNTTPVIEFSKSSDDTLAIKIILVANLKNVYDKTNYVQLPNLKLDGNSLPSGSTNQIWFK